MYIFQVSEVQASKCTWYILRSNLRISENIRENMENDGIKYYDNGKKDSCIDPGMVHIDLIPTNEHRPRQSQTFPPPPKLWKGVGEGEKTNVT